MDTLGSSVPDAASDAESAAVVIESPSSLESALPTPAFSEVELNVIDAPEELEASQTDMIPQDVETRDTALDEVNSEIAAQESEPEPPNGQQSPPTFLLEQPGLSTQPEPLTEDGELSSDETARPAVFELAELLEADPPERPENLVAVIESLLFVAEEPPSVRQLAEATNVSKDAVETALDEIESGAQERGLHIQRHGSTIRLVSAPESAQWVQRFLGLERPNKLSKAALETLAIIVYRQPVTRSEVEKIRGVGCDGPFHTLRLRELIESVGQTDAPGRPHLWGVTQYFLDHFGLKALDELPPLPGVSPSTQGKLALDRAPLLNSPDQDEPETTVDGASQSAAASAESASLRDVEDDESADDASELLGEFAAAGGSGD